MTYISSLSSSDTSSEYELEQVESASSSSDNSLIRGGPAIESCFSGELLNDASMKDLALRVYTADPAVLSSSQLNELRRIEAAVREAGILSCTEHPNFYIRDAHDGSVITQAHKSMLFLHSPYFAKRMAQEPFLGSELIVERQDLSNAAFKRVIEYLYLSDEEREEFLSDATTRTLNQVLDLATEWELDRLCELLERGLTRVNVIGDSNALLINGEGEASARRSLEEVYGRLEAADIQMNQASRQPNLKQRLLRIAGIILAIIFGGIVMPWSKVQSTRNGASEVTDGLQSFSADFAVALYWFLVIDGVFAHVMKDIFYIDKPYTTIMENQLVGDSEAIRRQVMGDDALLEKRCCSRYRVIDWGHKSLALTLGGLSLIPAFYKTFVNNDELSGWFHYMSSGVVTALKGPEMVLNYFLLLGHVRRRYFGRKDVPVPYEGKLEELKQSANDLLVPKEMTQESRCRRVWKKVRPYLAGTLFIPHFTVSLLYNWFAFSAISPTWGAVPLTGVSVMSDIYLKFFFPQGKITEPYLQDLQQPRSLRYLRNVVVASSLGAFPGAINDVNKTVAKITNSAGLIVAFKVLNSFYSMLLDYGVFWTTTRYYRQEAVAVCKRGERERHRTYHTLKKAEREIEESRQRLYQEVSLQEV